MTGLWQVTSRTDPSFESYIRCDLEYIENWSLLLDFEILARTTLEVVRGTGT
ncbi:MAG TPA: sugar transferase [Terriglobales bacterium]